MRMPMWHEIKVGHREISKPRTQQEVAGGEKQGESPILKEGKIKNRQLRIDAKAPFPFGQRNSAGSFFILGRGFNRSKNPSPPPSTCSFSRTWLPRARGGGSRLDREALNRGPGVDSGRLSGGFRLRMPPCALSWASPAVRRRQGRLARRGLGGLLKGSEVGSRWKLPC